MGLLTSHCIFAALWAGFRGSFRSRAVLQLEILALRHQLAVLQHSVQRPKLNSADRLLWAWLAQVWADWRSALVIVQPATVIAWHRKGFRLFWTWKVQDGRPGRQLSTGCRRPELTERSHGTGRLARCPRQTTHTQDQIRHLRPRSTTLPEAEEGKAPCVPRPLPQLVGWLVPGAGDAPPVSETFGPFRSFASDRRPIP